MFTHTQCIGQITAQQVGMNWLTKSWLEGSTYSTDNQDFSQEHSLPNVIEFALATKREPNIHIHESTHTHIGVGEPTQYTSGK